MSDRRTKRRFAHELYPQAEEWETRPLEVEVPCLYARALGFVPWGTGWFNAPVKESVAHTHHLIYNQEIALMADALLQGMTGQEAWKWVNDHMTDDGELVTERAMHYGVNPEQIKPYPCGPDPDHHDHMAEPDARGWRTVTRVEGPEDQCLDCTEPVTP
ncbi:hypothetical protein ABDK96_01985 [Citricoccus nitrophenolicus]|uniref:Uncharacterized protein n=1 Tax=Citricoccus nitrophenolicus TaxID=863575 RepID=A0ABV0IG36_9MICC